MTQPDWKSALRRTRRAAFGRVASLFGATDLDSAFWGELEAHLVAADIGIETTQDLIERLASQARMEGWLRRDQALAGLQAHLLGSLPAPTDPTLPEPPAVIVLVGVNGSGKTTSAARLGHHYQTLGKRVLLAAADTYRAAAAEQLGRWARLLGVGIKTGEPGSDPAAVAYRATERAVQGGIDVLLVDTSGRMQTSHNLMAELGKICRVTGKVVDGAPHHVWLVLDATTGQNAISQAQGFAQAVPVDGVILAKLDSSARGGVCFAIGTTLGLPIEFVGLGEQISDLARFDRRQFVQNLLGPDQ